MKGSASLRRKRGSEDVLAIQLARSRYFRIAAIACAIWSLLKVAALTSVTPEKGPFEFALIVMAGIASIAVAAGVVTLIPEAMLEVEPPSVELGSATKD